MNPSFSEFGKNKFAGVTALEHAVPRRAQSILGRSAAALAFLLLILPVFPLFQDIPTHIAWGVFFIALSLTLAAIMLNCFANSKTFQKQGNLSGVTITERLNFFAAGLWYRGIIDAHREDAAGLLGILPRTVAGKIILIRMGIRATEYEPFARTLISSTPDPALTQQFRTTLEKSIAAGGDITLADILGAAMQTDERIAAFFAQKGLTDMTVAEAAHWIERGLAREDANRRWWLREHLGRIPGLAKDLAYGRVFVLQSFARDITESGASAPEEQMIGLEQEIKRVESALLRQSGANVIIIGESGTARSALLAGLAALIASGKIFPELEHKRIFQLNTASLVAAGKTKGETQALILTILNEAVAAGNIILAIDNFPEFVHSLAALGVSADEVLSPYLASPALHIVALGDAINFRRILEADTGLMEHFEKIEMPEPEGTALMEILEDAAPRIEAGFRKRALFTYPSLQKIAEAATNNLVDGSMPERAVRLAQETMEEAMVRGLSVIPPDLVFAIVTRKTKMPLGAIGEKEQGQLLNLETLLRARVIGQNEATDAVADAIRRVRSGIQNPKRPIGTFLFMGPTGVGKTETAKTVAATYFGNEDALIRFDMTEYHDSESVTRLIGSFEKNEPGILADRMRAAPYGVVLLDEFEKAHLTVRNLFLQILDEGFFSDYLGTRVNMRNTIIIATSNAGSALIAELTQKGTDHPALISQVIAFAEKEGILSPELLNRFDAVVVFRPLAPDTLLAIARLMLAELASRLKKQNIIFSPADDLAQAVATGGYDPVFGARPMRRFIQDRIEKAIAEKIIRREIMPGTSFSLSATDIADR